ncbi:hypothetical protein EYF80_005726 [Liparis tanakae]|uniref:Uncharacterized protein n=1 Tax=Liparis tanakae TaxID=230148 RepID=A0A4Z2J0J8_9TELE|nr:hypothetical protein EYF80_005726 [Liparis tanakae]
MERGQEAMLRGEKEREERKWDGLLSISQGQIDHQVDGSFATEEQESQGDLEDSRVSKQSRDKTKRQAEEGEGGPGWSCD